MDPRPSTMFPRMSRLAVLACLALAAACTQSAPPPPPPAPPPPKTAEQRVQWYQDCWRLFNEKAWDGFSNCYTENATSEEIDSGMPVSRGRAAIIEAAKKGAETFPDRRGEVKLVLGSGPHLASVATWTATNDGPLPSPDGKTTPATHKKVGLFLVHTAELDATGSQVVSDASILDDGTLMAQLGLRQAPARKLLAPTGAPPTVVIAKNDDTEAKNTAAFRAVVTAANAHDMKAFAAGLADDYTLIDVTMPADANKKTALAGMTEYMTAFPDLTMTASNIWAAGDYVVANGTFAGTNKGPMRSMGLMKPTGKPVSVRFIEIVKFENGKAKEDWTFYNGAAFATQLGMK